MVKYFQIRSAWESKQYEKVGAAELLRIGQGRTKYGGASYEALYGQWKGGDRNRPTDLSDARGTVLAAFSATYKVTENYSTIWIGQCR
jgi:hypothetical protein